MTPTIRHIQEIVADHFAMPLEKIARGRIQPRSPDNTARQVAMFLAREMTGRSYTVIARRFSRKDHSTIIHAVHKVRRLMEENAGFAEEMQTILRTASIAVDNPGSIVADATVGGA